MCTEKTHVPAYRMLPAGGQVEKWDVLELELPGFSQGNPFRDYTIRGVFQGEQETVSADGFYDGNGIYRIRFMPSFEGKYSFRVEGSFSPAAQAGDLSGSFTVLPPQAGNHGPVRTAAQYHLAYEDGTPYYSIGTTCYAWCMQEEALQEQTLLSLSDLSDSEMVKGACA